MTNTIHPSPTLLLLCALCAACPTLPAGTDSDTDPDTATTTDASTGTTTSGPPPGTTASPPTTSGDATTLTATTGPAPGCPDGHLDDGEVCDDGNTINGDGCNNDCQPSGERLFEVHPATRGHDEVRSVAVDADGTVVIGGRGPGQTGWVARFDPQLTPLWSQLYTPKDSAIVLSVALTDSSIYIAGGTHTDVDAEDSWTARLSADGVVEWEDHISSGFGGDYLTQAAVIGETDLIVTGFAADPDGLTTLWTRRYAPDGVATWTATFPLDTTFKISPLGPGLAVTPDAIVVGWSLPSAKYAEFLAAWPHTGGAPLWTRTSASTGTIMGIAVSSGGLALVGRRDDVLGVRQVTATGESLWISDACTGKNGRDIAVDSQGDIVVIGDGDGPSGTSIRLCKFAADGTFRWGKDIDGGFGNDLGYAVAIDADDRIIAGGSMPGETLAGDPWLAVFSP